MNGNIDSNGIAIYEEVFEDNFIIDEKDISEYGHRLGVDIQVYPNLTGIIRDWLLQPLPQYWYPCCDTRSQHWFYFNILNGESSWQHPLERIHQTLLQEFLRRKFLGLNETQRGAPEGESAEHSTESIANESTMSTFPHLIPFPAAKTPVPTRTLAPLRRVRKLDRKSTAGDGTNEIYSQHSHPVISSLTSEDPDQNNVDFIPEFGAPDRFANTFNSSTFYGARASEDSGHVRTVNDLAEQKKADSDDSLTNAFSPNSKDGAMFSKPSDETNGNIVRRLSVNHSFKPLASLSFTERLAAKKASRVKPEEQAVKNPVSGELQQDTIKRVQFNLGVKEIRSYTPELSENDRHSELSERFESSSPQDLLQLIGDPNSLEPIAVHQAPLQTSENKCSSAPFRPLEQNTLSSGLSIDDNYTWQRAGGAQITESVTSFIIDDGNDGDRSNIFGPPKSRLVPCSLHVAEQNQDTVTVITDVISTTQAQHNDKALSDMSHSKSVECLSPLNMQEAKLTSVRSTNGSTDLTPNSRVRLEQDVNAMQAQEALPYTSNDTKSKLNQNINYNVEIKSTLRSGNRVPLQPKLGSLHSTFVPRSHVWIEEKNDLLPSMSQDILLGNNVRISPKSNVPMHEQQNQCSPPKLHIFSQKDEEMQPNPVHVPKNQARSPDSHVNRSGQASSNSSTPQESVSIVEENLLSVSVEKKGGQSEHSEHARQVGGSNFIEESFQDERNSPEIRSDCTDEIDTHLEQSPIKCSHNSQLRSNGICQQEVNSFPNAISSFLYEKPSDFSAVNSTHPMESQLFMSVEKDVAPLGVSKPPPPETNWGNTGIPFHAPIEEMSNMRLKMEIQLEEETRKLEGWFKEELSKLKAGFELQLIEERNYWSGLLEKEKEKLAVHFINPLESGKCQERNRAKTDQDDNKPTSNSKLRHEQSPGIATLEQGGARIFMKSNPTQDVVVQTERMEFVQDRECQTCCSPEIVAIEKQEKRTGLETSFLKEKRLSLANLGCSLDTKMNAIETSVSTETNNKASCHCEHLKKHVALVEREMQLLKGKHKSGRETSRSRKGTSMNVDDPWCTELEDTTSNASSLSEWIPMEGKSRSLANLIDANDAFHRRSFPVQRARHFLAKHGVRRRAWVEESGTDFSSDTPTSGISSSVSNYEWDNVMRSIQKISGDLREVWSHLGQRPRFSFYQATNPSWGSDVPNPLPMHWTLNGSTAERTRALKQWLQQTNQFSQLHQY